MTGCSLRRELSNSSNDGNAFKNLSRSRILEGSVDAHDKFTSIV